MLTKVRMHNNPLQSALCLPVTSIITNVTIMNTHGTWCIKQMYLTKYRIKDKDDLCNFL